METMLKILKEVKSVVMDSRKVEKGDLFLAINSGNEYIEEVLKKGASYIIADDPKGYENHPRVLKVRHTLETIQNLATTYVKTLKKEGLKVVAITGSNGKTTTKDFIRGVLSERFKCLATTGNYNNHIGVPYTLLNLKEDHEIAVIEMGMSDFGEIDLLTRIAQPDIGVITNIGDSHLEFLKSRENVFRAKTEMFRYIPPSGRIVYGEDPFLEKLEADKIILEDFTEGSEGALFRIFGEEYRIKLNGRYNALNAAMAVDIGKRFSMDSEEIQDGLLNASITHMRFEKMDRENRHYINDAYNASPISMAKSLETFAEVYAGKDTIAVLGDMLELGEQEIEFHKEVIGKALNLGIDRIYLYGPRMEKASSEFRGRNIRHFKDKREIQSVLLEEKKDIYIFLKGSRGMKMEDIIA